MKMYAIFESFGSFFSIYERRKEEDTLGELSEIVIKTINLKTIRGLGHKRGCCSL